MWSGRLTVDRPLANIWFAVLLANHSAHLTDGLHGTDQVLLHRHFQIPPKSKVVLGWGRRIVLRPLVAKIVAAGLLSADGTHLANGLHTTDQVLFHSHSLLPPNLSCCFLSKYESA